MTVLSLLVVALLLSQFVQPQPQGIGVKPGDWARYEKRFYEKLTNNNYYGDNVTYSHIRRIDINILSVGGTQVTYTQTLRRDNGSAIWQATYTVDPTKPIESTYSDPLILEGEIQLLLAPSDIKAGDKLPETIWLRNADNTELVPYEWFQRVNSTTIEGDPLNPMKVNHVEWSVDSHIVDGDQVFEYHEDRSLDFDQATGLTLRLVIRWEGVGYYDNYLHYDRASFLCYYRLIDSSATLHNYTVATITVGSLFVAVILAIHPRRGPANKLARTQHPRRIHPGP